MTDVASGHNGIAADELRAFVERAERFDAEIADLNSDKSDLFKEAKCRGFDTKILKEVIRIRRKNYAERQEHDAILELYLSALGEA